MAPVHHPYHSSQRWASRLVKLMPQLKISAGCLLARLCWTVLHLLPQNTTTHSALPDTCSNAHSSVAKPARVFGSGEYLTVVQISLFRTLCFFICKGMKVVGWDSEQLGIAWESHCTEEWWWQGHDFLLLVFEVRKLLYFIHSFNLSKVTWPCPSFEQPLSITMFEDFAAKIAEFHLQDLSIVLPRHTTGSACFCLEKGSVVCFMLVTRLSQGSAIKAISNILHTQHTVSCKGQLAWEDLSDFRFSLASLQFSNSAAYKINKAVPFAAASRCSKKHCCTKDSKQELG